MIRVLLLCVPFKGETESNPCLLTDEELNLSNQEISCLNCFEYREISLLLTQDLVLHLFALKTFFFNFIVL